MKKPTYFLAGRSMFAFLTPRVIRASATALFISLSMSGNPALAQTSDGQTPAQEEVCDSLMADDVTKGLYGLCVAFCEAHDAASVDEPISDEDFQALSDSPPNGKILENYNKRKKDTDPSMPCIALVSDDCPCFTTNELTSAFLSEPSRCKVGYSGSKGLFADDDVSDSPYAFTLIIPGSHVCSQRNVNGLETYTYINQHQFEACNIALTTVGRYWRCME